jgi:formylglycine-generating enzyme required for sulfatase activity
MVAVPLNFCIDSTEVTIAQYKAWLDKPTTSTANQYYLCGWNDSFVPTMDWPPTDPTSSKPVTYVDWCDAYAYCKDMGKHLCGKIGGGSNGFNDYTDYTKSQWFAACTSNGAYAPSGYPYGNTYSPSSCNTRDYWGSGVGTLMYVKELFLCQSSLPGYVGVYDLSGNVQEWEDSCDGTAGASDTCRQRGGSFWARAADGFIGSQCSAGGINPRSVKQDDSGFRCCAF